MIIYDNNVTGCLEQLIASMSPDRVFILTDTNSQWFVYPRLMESAGSLLRDAKTITVKSGDMNKNIDQLTDVWRYLCREGATRNSLLINLGGGMVCDLGGFAAATFKRGIRFINVPTTLLAAVDASSGGKTGINLDSYKNEVGAFRNPDAVVISTVFFSTLPDYELMSGYAEMLKHAILEGDEALNSILEDVPSKENISSDGFLEVVRRSVEIKVSVVEQDPCEKGLRRVLNLGHTAGHAFETFALKTGRAFLSHGHAVALGICVELILSRMLLDFDSERMYAVVEFVKEHYGPLHITCDDYPALLGIMGHDKKNPSAGQISFTLMKSPGNPHPGIIVDSKDIEAAMDIYRDMFGI